MLPWLTRLKDRLWVRAAIAYGVVAWVLLQIVSIVAEPLGLPRQSLAFAIIAICCGFPFVVLLAWAAERPGPRASAAHWYQRVGGWRLALAASVALFGGVVAHWWLERLSAGETPAVARVTLAVLPFVNMSGDPANDYLGDGLSEELSSELARVPGLAVVARTSAFAYKGKNQDVAQI